MKWTDLPVLVRRTVDVLIEQTGEPLRVHGDPREDGSTVVIPLTGPSRGGVEYEAVIAADGSGHIRKAA